jgi:hypothetical protein
VYGRSAPQADNDGPTSQVIPHHEIRSLPDLDNVLCASRPALEAYVRGRVAALPNVVISGRHEAVGLLTTDDRARVNGVRILPIGGSEQRLPADLVVDATGRGNRGPTWLAEIGYAAQAEDLVKLASST